MPVVGSSLILTPMCMKVCIIKREIKPTNANFINSSFSAKILFKTLYPISKNKIAMNNTKNTPNSSEITEKISGLIIFAGGPGGWQPPPV